MFSRETLPDGSTRLPPLQPDPAALAEHLLNAQTKHTHLAIPAEARRQLARTRQRAARIALPLFLALAVAALAVSLDLAGLAVICGFFAFACTAILRDAARQLLTATDLEISLVATSLHITGRPAGTVTEMLARSAYVRLLLDTPGGPSSLDLPLAPDQRQTLADALRAADIPVTRESPARRAGTLIGALALALLALVAARVALGLAALSLASLPLTAIVLAAVALATWTLRRWRG